MGEAVNRFWRRLIDFVSRGLEPAEREAVLGDLAESTASGAGKLRDSRDPAPSRAGHTDAPCSPDGGGPFGVDWAACLKRRDAPAVANCHSYGIPPQRSEAADPALLSPEGKVPRKDF